MFANARSAGVTIQEDLVLLVALLGLGVGQVARHEPHSDSLSGIGHVVGVDVLPLARRVGVRVVHALISHVKQAGAAARRAPRRRALQAQLDRGYVLHRRGHVGNGGAVDAEPRLIEQTRQRIHSVAETLLHRLEIGYKVVVRPLDLDFGHETTLLRHEGVLPCRVEAPGDLTPRLEVVLARRSGGKDLAPVVVPDAIVRLNRSARRRGLKHVGHVGPF